MEKKPNKEISPEEFKKLVLSKITNPDSIPKGDWLPPEIIIEDINLDNSFPLEHLVFENIDLRKIRLTFKNCLLKGRYRFDNFNVRSLVFINTKIDNFELKNSNLTIFNYIQSTSYLFRIENTAFKQHCSISQRNIQSSIRLIKIDTGQLNLSNIESNSLTVSNSSAKKLTIHKGQFDNLILSNNNFELAHLHSPDNQSLQVNNTLKIINDTPVWKIGQLKLGPNFNTKTEIRGTEKHSFKIDNISISDVCKFIIFFCSDIELS